ncbi:MAG: argininosuccinate lyase [Syntrophotaleaceae bacterium]
MSKKPWAGRFTQPTDEFVEAFTASIDFDQRLYRYDIQGSIAHARMLAKQGIIADQEAQTIITGLNSILVDIEAGDFEFSVTLEDIHMNIEARLIERIGSVGGKLHTARSRNDQVALDVRLYLRDELQAVRGYLDKLQEALLSRAETNLGVVMPGYTHLQTAQPVLFSHHMLAYYEMLRRDAGRLKEPVQTPQPVASGRSAPGQTTFPIDREFVAEQLGFDGVTRNSLDSVSDRDFALEFCSVSAILQ